MFGGFFSNMSVYAKAVVAFLGALGTFLVTILAEQSVTHVLPPAWVMILGMAASTLTGLATYAKKNATADPAERARQELEKAQRRVEEVSLDIPGLNQGGVTPVGDVVDRVIDTARGQMP